MGLFKREKKVVKEIYGAAWGYLVTQGIDVDTLAKDIRCVEREGSMDGEKSVTFLRVFSLKEAAKKGIQVGGWETFDQNPDMILFEGYITRLNRVNMERKKALSS